MTEGPELLTVTEGPALLTVTGPELLTVTDGPELLTVTDGPELLTVTAGPELLTLTPGPLHDRQKRRNRLQSIEGWSHSRRGYRDGLRQRECGHQEEEERGNADH